MGILGGMEFGAMLNTLGCKTRLKHVHGIGSFFTRLCFLEDEDGIETKRVRFS